MSIYLHIYCHLQCIHTNELTVNNFATSTLQLDSPPHEVHASLNNKTKYLYNFSWGPSTSTWLFPSDNRLWSPIILYQFQSCRRRPWSYVRRWWQLSWSRDISRRCWIPQSKYRILSLLWQHWSLSGSSLSWFWHWSRSGKNSIQLC